MSVLRALIIAFSMFSRIPMPRTDWSGKNMRWMMAWFPFVGVAVGGAILLWNWGSAYLGFGPLLRGAGLAIVPLLVTGGIHLDGFCDTVDALASHAPAERKREILKDPHTGAFAVIWVCAYLLFYFALCSELAPTREAILLYALGFVLSRCLSGLSVVLFPAVGGEGLLSTFRASAEKRVTVAILVALALVTGLLMTLLLPPAGVLLPLAALLCLACLYRTARGSFGGMSGDLAGWFLQLCELAMLGVLILIQKVVAV